MSRHGHQAEGSHRQKGPDAAADRRQGGRVRDETQGQGDRVEVGMGRCRGRTQGRNQEAQE